MTHFYLFSLNHKKIVIISASDAMEAKTKFERMTPDQLFVLRNPSKYTPIHYLYLGSAKDYIWPIELTDLKDICKLNLDKDIIFLVTNLVNPQPDLSSGVHFSTDKALDPNRTNPIEQIQ